MRIGIITYSQPAIYVIVFVLVAFYLRKFQNQRMYIMIFACIIPFVGILVMSLLENEPKYKWIKWGMFDITVVFSLALFLGWSLGMALFLTVRNTLTNIF